MLSKTMLSRNPAAFAAIYTMLIACSSDPESRGRYVASADPIPDRYVVVLASDGPMNLAAAEATANDLAASFAARIDRTYQHALHGFSATMSEADARALSLDPRVRLVEEDARVRAIAVQEQATWGLDRLDGAEIGLDGLYHYESDGTGVTAYVLDTGIRTSHSDFSGRAVAGFTSIEDGLGSEDCDGHGTHVAGTIGGATWGVAKNVALVAVRVMNCEGSGTISGVVAGIDWVTANASLPAVANMSLGGGASPALDEAVANSIASGVVYAVAAGNETTDACARSPARVPEALTVGASDAADNATSFSNYGPCVDLFAPGLDITSAWITDDQATNTVSGTSMATPHVAGAAAAFLSTRPNATPGEVGAALVGNAIYGQLTAMRPGTTNTLLQTSFIAPAEDQVAPFISFTSPGDGDVLSGEALISFETGDDVGVADVSIFLDGVYASTSTTSPFSFAWDTSAEEIAFHTLMAIARDSAGNAASARIDVTVNNSEGTLAEFDDALQAPACATPVEICDTGAGVDGRGPTGPEPNAPNTIADSCADGTLGSYHVDESVDCIVVRADEGTVLRAGRTARIEVTVWAFSAFASDTLDSFYASDATNPSWTLLTSMKPEASGAQVLTATHALSGDELQAVRAAFRYSDGSGPCPDGGWNDRDDVVFAVAPELDVEPPSISFTAPSDGEVLAGMVTVIASATDDRAVQQMQLQIDGEIADAVFGSELSYEWDTTPIPDGLHTLSVIATDTSGNQAMHSITVETENADPTLAEYSPLYQVPACLGASSRCDTGDLIHGRHELGPEPNHPNTLYGSCGDGTAGQYHSDESIDRIVISSVDGAPITAGRPARIEVTVWGYDELFDVDNLDLYITTDISEPTWTHFATAVATQAGAHVLTATFTPAFGQLQAVRAMFGPTWAFPGPCSESTYAESDDVVFAVQPGELGTPRAPDPGELVISELHYNPSATEPYGEWFEVTNASTALLDLDGLVLESGPSFFPVGTVALDPGQRVVFCRSANSGPAGCVEYARIRLNNYDDDISIIAPDGKVIDSVGYTSGGDWPKSRNGFSIELSESALDFGANDLGENWCHARSLWGDDLASPGAPGSCP